MTPKGWKELFHKAHVLAVEFQKYLSLKNIQNPEARWAEELCELRLGLIFLISPMGTSAAVPQEGTCGTAEHMRAAKIVIESLEKTYSGILAMNFKKRNG